jgi:hypothetical protein
MQLILSVKSRNKVAVYAEGNREKRLCIGICIYKGLVGIMKMSVTFWWGSRLGLVCSAISILVVPLTRSYYEVLSVTR